LLDNVSLGLNPPLTADYNKDGFRDAADYTLWRDTMGQNVTPGTGADGSNDGLVGLHDYRVWKHNFVGVVAGGSTAESIPEPTTLLLALLALVAAPLRVRCG